MGGTASCPGSAYLVAMVDPAAVEKATSLSIDESLELLAKVRDSLVSLDPHCVAEGRVRGRVERPRMELDRAVSHMLAHEVLPSSPGDERVSPIAANHAPSGRGGSLRMSRRQRRAWTRVQGGKKHLRGRGSRLMGCLRITIGTRAPSSAQMRVVTNPTLRLH